MNNPFENNGAGLLVMVGEFIKAAEQELSVDLVINLTLEEAKETLEAAAFDPETASVEQMAAYIKEVCDLVYVSTMAQIVQQEFGITQDLATYAGMSDDDQATIGMAFHTVGAAADMFLDDSLMVEAFNRVHASNMSKVEGGVIFNEDGKVMKGPNYVAPDLTDLAEEALDKLATHIMLIKLMSRVDNLGV